MPDLPESGGEYTRDPKTGQLTKVADIPPPAATDPDIAPEAPVKKAK